MELSAKTQAIIETERLLLKELNPEVLHTLFTTGTDSEIMSELGLKTTEELDAEREKFRLGMTTYRMSFKTFLLVEKETGKAIGKCGFHDWYAIHSRSELGYRMLDEAAKRKGFMTEALCAVIRYGFEEMKLNRIQAFIGSENIPSLKLIKRAGFTEEGTLRSHYCNNGKLEDSICFSLLKDEYEFA
jgi:ribosomal-protein-alanine N-acetyltransferase